MSRQTLNIGQPDRVLGSLFPTLEFSTHFSARKPGYWFIYVSKGREFIGMFWDKREEFPSDKLVAQLMLVS